MVRPIDQEMIAIEKSVCPLQFPGGRGILWHGGAHGEVPGLVRRQGEVGMAGKGFCGMGKVGLAG